MPRKEEVTYYTFDELSKEAKERAIQDYRDKGWDWDYHDSEMLSDSFKDILKERGFNDDVEVYWNLGYSQGDGVCFEGRLDLERFFDQDGFRTYREMAPYIYIQIKNNNHSYCHWNSMTVEAELESMSAEDMIPESMKERWWLWRQEVDSLERNYKAALEDVMRRRRAPIRAWQERIRQMPKGPLEWIPEMEAPPELDIPIPEEPDYQKMPGDVKRSIDAAERKIKRIEAKLGPLEEDVQKWVKDLSRELEKIGYDEIEYRGSDKVIAETLEANEYEFTEDGEMV